MFINPIYHTFVLLNACHLHVHVCLSKPLWGKKVIRKVKNKIIWNVMHTCTKQSDFIYSLLLHYYYFELLSFNLHCKNLKLKTKSYSLVILHAMKRYFRVCQKYGCLKFKFSYFTCLSIINRFLNSIVL